jgi:hypothetical protein
MWIFTTEGFISAVQDSTDDEKLVIRARDRKSLESMLQTIELAGEAINRDAEEGVEPVVFGPYKIETGKGTDYRWRVSGIDRGTFALFMQFEIMNFLQYTNYKNALTESRGKVYHDAAMRVWVDMLAVDDGVKIPGRQWDLSGADWDEDEPSWEEIRAMELEDGAGPETDEEFAELMSEAPNA